MSVVLKYNHSTLHAVLKAVLFFDVLKKAFQVDDIAALFGARFSTKDELMHCLTILEEQDIIKHSKNGYTLYGREHEMTNEKPTRFSDKLLFLLLQLAWWIDGVIKMPAHSLQKNVYLAKNIDGSGLLSPFYLKLTKKVFQFFGKELILLSRNYKVYQEEILTAFLIRNAEVIKNKAFYTKINSENQWINAIVKKYQDSSFGINKSNSRIRKFRKTDTSFSRMLIELKLNLDFEDELKRREKYALQWLLPKLDIKPTSNKMV